MKEANIVVPVAIGLYFLMLSYEMGDRGNHVLTLVDHGASLLLLCGGILSLILGVVGYFNRLERSLWD